MHAYIRRLNPVLVTQMCVYLKPEQASYNSRLSFKGEVLTSSINNLWWVKWAARSVNSDRNDLESW